MSHERVEEEETSLKVCRAFKEDPFKTAKEVITQKVKSGSKVPKKVLNEYIQKVASDTDMTVPLGELDGLNGISINIGKFNSEKLEISELSQVVKKKRIASQPGPNQIPYEAVFFFCLVFFHEHSLITGLQGKGEGISLTPQYHFHPLHRHLDVSRAITAESLPLHITSSRTRTGNLWFPSASR